MKRTNFIRTALSAVIFFLISFISVAQNIGINSTGAAPNASAILDVDGTNGGLLIPRMSTIDRNLIASPANSLMIYNTTDNCLQIYIGTAWIDVVCGCSGVPTAVTAVPSPNPICAGSTLTLTGGAIGATSWSWTGPNGFTSTLQSPTIAAITTAGAGVYALTASNSCGSAAPMTTASVTVSGTGTGTQMFSYTGAVQTFTVPACVTSITIEALGAQGHNINLGGKAVATISVTPGETLNIYVGGRYSGSNNEIGGWNGGGSSIRGTGTGWSGAGGGASDVRRNPYGLSDRIIVAGGSGGGGGVGGGAGGGTTCSDGVAGVGGAGEW